MGMQAALLQNVCHIYSVCSMCFMLQCPSSTRAEGPVMKPCLPAMAGMHVPQPSCCQCSLCQPMAAIQDGVQVHFKCSRSISASQAGSACSILVPSSSLMQAQNVATRGSFTRVRMDVSLSRRSSRPALPAKTNM